MRCANRYEAAWAVYEPLPQTDEEAVLWNEFVSAWNSWREVNGRIIEMAREIDDTDILNPDELEARLMGFTRDHHVLMEQTLLLLVTGETFAGGDDPTACAFGRWLAGFSTNNARIDSLLNEVHAYHDPFHEAVGTIKALVADGRTGEATNVFTGEMQPNAEGVFQTFDGLTQEAQRVVGNYDAMNELAAGEMTERETEAMGLLNDIIHINEDVAEEAVATANAEGRNVEFIALVGMVAGVALALVLGVLLTRAITKPIAKGVHFAELIARGELDIELDVEQKDEIGVLADALRGMLASLQYKAGLLEEISQGNLTVDVELASDQDGLGKSLVRMVESLNDILGQVQTAIEQVAAGAPDRYRARARISRRAPPNRRARSRRSPRRLTRSMGRASRTPTTRPRRADSRGRRRATPRPASARWANCEPR